MYPINYLKNGADTNMIKNNELLLQTKQELNTYLEYYTGNDVLLELNTGEYLFSMLGYQLEELVEHDIDTQTIGEYVKAYIKFRNEQLKQLFY